MVIGWRWVKPSLDHLSWRQQYTMELQIKRDQYSMEMETKREQYNMEMENNAGLCLRLNVVEITYRLRSPTVTSAIDKEDFACGCSVDSPLSTRALKSCTRSTRDRGWLLLGPPATR